MSRGSRPARTVFPPVRADAGAEESPRLLVVKLADLGDALLATPALARLRRNLPGARISVLTTGTGAPAFRHAGLVDEVLVFDEARHEGAGGLPRGPGAAAALRLARELRAMRPDAILLLHPLTTRLGALKHAGLVLSAGAPLRAGLAKPGLAAWRSWFLNLRQVDRGFEGWHVVEAGEAVVDALLEAMGPEPAILRPADRHPRFLPGAEAESSATALLQREGFDLDEAGRARGLVAIHPGSGGFSEARRWPPERFAALIDALQRAGRRCLLVGRSTDGAEAVLAACARPPWCLIDQTPLPLLAALLGRADALVANDGGIMHLAAAMGTPVVAIFGPSNERYWGPYWPGADREGRRLESPHAIVSLDLPCRPCFYSGHGIGSREGCATRDCLSWLPPRAVLAALERAAPYPPPRAPADRAAP